MSAPLNPEFESALNDGPAAIAELWGAGYQPSKEECAALAAKRFFDQTALNVDRFARARIRYKKLRDEMGPGAEERLRRLESETGLHIRRLRCVVAQQQDWRVNARVKEIESSESNSEESDSDLD